MGFYSMAEQQTWGFSSRVLVNTTGFSACFPSPVKKKHKTQNTPHTAAAVALMCLSGDKRASGPRE